jgi:transposase
MSSIAKSWVRIFCEHCKSRQTWVLREHWTLVCSNCGHEKTLRHGVLGR